MAAAPPDRLRDRVETARVQLEAARQVYERALHTYRERLLEMLREEPQS